MTAPSLARRLLLLSHVCLLGAVAATVWTSDLGASARIAMLVVALVPLLAAGPGLLAARPYTHQWLSVVLVPYVGIAAVEAVAGANRTNPANIVLLAALLELGLLLMLVRRARSAAPRE